jgi:DNA repair exonuclease SbcCD ATPase subunit
MGHRLLVVDSDRRFLQDHKVSLESSFDVDFRDGTEGTLAHLEGGDYAAVLLCVEASENKGYSLCSAIRRSPALADLKVVLISAKATEEEYARHQSLKGKADLYLHKPIRPNALVSALTPVAPLKAVDPDNPLGDLGGTDLGDEWLESLKSELEMDTVPSTVFQPPPPPPPVPVSALLGFTRPLLPLTPPPPPQIPKDAGRVELLESRVKDLETKLVSTCDDLDRKREALEELERAGAAAKTLLEEKALLAMELETRLTSAEAGLEQNGRDLEELIQQEQEARNLLQEKTRLNMDLMESNQLLQAQLAEAKEDAERLSRSQQALEEQNRALEAERQEGRSGMEALEASALELRQELEALAENHDRQQMELLAAIDDREARLGRMEETLNAQREQILLLEQEKETTAGQLQLRAERWLALVGRLADLESQVHQTVELTKIEMN